MRRTSRRILGAFAFCILGFVGYFIGDFWLHKPGPTTENFCRLHKGMTRSQIESQLGRGEYSLPGGPGFTFSEAWRTQHCEITIWYFGETSVGGRLVAIDQDQPPEELADDALEQVRQWIKNQTGW